MRAHWANDGNKARDAKIKEILLGLDSRFLNDYEPSAFDRKQIKKALLLLEDEEASE